ncbi:hypothetical protein B0T11DRAFT_68644 [Plectosphaerella cucumerina]|uniref:Uncharacterized protein n=1 Tax=Plectosphaerella cucumerina TaxID=40658 RepID=A0A8K0X6J2_9PEZI|nr:hypothetical protein B0T11DRAFT_68644 [Plectosphaerella cucumerina]
MTQVISNEITGVPRGGTLPRGGCPVHPAAIPACPGQPLSLSLSLSCLAPGPAENNGGWVGYDHSGARGKTGRLCATVRDPARSAGPPWSAPFPEPIPLTSPTPECVRDAAKMDGETTPNCLEWAKKSPHPPPHEGLPIVRTTLRQGASLAEAGVFDERPVPRSRPPFSSLPSIHNPSATRSLPVFLIPFSPFTCSRSLSSKEHLSFDTIFLRHTRSCQPHDNSSSAL